ncbi:MAG TPA: CHRD domain-containing protein [Cyanobacteria bacterium UBA11149]|nr:CHRD domain-containing protein [Cyanobacteria bacterium UBA11367]HBE60711.1 CHRD domain-containing protein [Cyanobacteria bacterium UBA11366]HBK64030.1 CHRD domain-containing protein [Cyanobacteria bacterium UBA11166]HBR74491.1 CHRD domain-containing protein [Cyanobacteria bacterium UBA11159]HBS68289.1 CHRD domain-containing protein [Cyanobacteria bacterium UBA11153]HBW91370.1 CHRD domain-containing protein [Cyanobacteria bacterium UBA11149]HCA93595.1 CHRD domain-containing protein [Cyanob
MRRTIGLFISLLFALTTLFASIATAQEHSFGNKSFNQYEGYLHPTQEPGPAFESPAQGYGILRVPRNLSSATIDVNIVGVNLADITAFHIHCGSPGVLGPIIVNFGQFGDLKNTIKNGRLSVSITNENLTFIKQPPPPPSLSGGFKLPLPEGCPSELNLPGQVNTIAGLDALARKGVLYFNLHTKEHEFFGEMRGQIYPAAG